MNPTISPAADLPKTEEKQQTKWTVGTLSYTSAGLVVLFCWLLWGDFAWSMRERSVSPVVLLLFKKFEASDMLTGFLIGTLPAALSMVIGPLVSYRSDRHRGRWGRRIPFLLFSTPMVVIALVGLGISPALGTGLHHLLGSFSLGLNPMILLILGLMWTVFEMACMITNSVFGGLVNDVVPQTVMGRFYGMFRALSLIAGIVFNFWLFAKGETHYLAIFVGIAILYGVGFMLMCIKVKEGEYPAVSDPLELPKKSGNFFRAVRCYFKECFGNRYYLWFFAMMAASTLSAMPVNVFGVFYAKSIQMDMALYGKCLAVTYCISLVLAYPIGILVDRFHPLRVCTLTLGLYGVCTLWSGFYARDISTFCIAIIAHGVISGTFFTASASIGQKLLPRERFAELMSASGIVSSLCSMALPACMGFILDRTGHQYYYTFLASSAITALAVVLYFIMDRKFVALGGPENYQAPE